MKYKPYHEKLKDPRWQRRRLEIMQKQRFTCELCETKTEELHIHHFYYEKGKEPWDYPDRALKCLCSECHKEVADKTLNLLQNLSMVPFDYIQWEDYNYLMGTFNITSQPDSFYHMQAILQNWWIYNKEDFKDLKVQLDKVLNKYKKRCIELDKRYE